MQTSEGAKAYEEAISLLMQAQPVAELDVAGPMCSANALHVSDIGVSGATGHRGSDGNKAAQRLRNSGGVVQGGGAVKEGIEFGQLW